MIQQLTGITSCTDCELAVNGFVVVGDGPVPCKIMVVGEAPGEDESLEGKPFVGRAGEELNLLLERAGLHRDGVYVTNVVHHWPGPGNPTPKVTQQRACQPWLDCEIASVEPEIILLLGTTAITAVLGKVDISYHHGIPLLHRDRIMIPMYHPAAGMHSPGLKPIIRSDFRDISVRSTAHKRAVNYGVDVGGPCASRGDIISIDTETRSLGGKELVTMSYAESDDAHVHYYPTTFDQRASQVIMHNAAFDQQVLRQHGIHIPWSIIWDTMLSAAVLGKEHIGLKARGLRELGWWMEEMGSEKDASKVDPDFLSYYTACDAVATRALYYKDREELQVTGGERLFSIEQRLSPVLLDITARGVGVDYTMLSDLGKRFAEQIQQVVQKIYYLAGHEFSVDSPAQLRKVLFEELGIQPRKKTKTKASWSTDDEALAWMESQHDIVAQIREYRGLTKLKGTYADGLPQHLDADGRIHTTLRQAGAVSGRISSADPNLQNIPYRTALGKQIRNVFIPSPGKVFVSADYKQIELVVAAVLANDTNMLNIFRSGGDIHQNTIDTVLHGFTGEGSRTLAKNINFGMVYGLSADGLRIFLSKLDPPVFITNLQAAAIIDAFFTQYSGLASWLQRERMKALLDGYTETPLHRRRYFPYLHEMTQNAQVAALKAAVNHPIQGGAAEIMKLAMVMLADTPMVLQIHDELMWEAAPEHVVDFGHHVTAVMKEAALEVIGFAPGIDVVTATSWGDL